jgi:ubiquinone/menaquinone biosynthesis C-methylase UbiE
MNLNNYGSRNDLLIDWVLETIPPNARVLDVGANDGTFAPEVRRLAERVSHFAGVDPDRARLERNPYMAERFYSRLEEACIPPHSFDCLIAIYVLEHVERPMEFLSAAARTIKPGGSLFFITPNGNHYFAALAGMFAALGIQRQVLSLIRPSALIEQYHYPAVYRLNRPSSVRARARRSGFDQAEFRYSERLEEFSCYFPGPTKILPWMWERGVAIARAESLLGNLMGKLSLSSS